MCRSITLAALIGIAASLGAPDCLRAQTAADVAPVPGPYRAAPAAGTPAYANPAHARNLPYWMRSQPGTGNRTSPVFIPGWVWSPDRSNRRPTNPPTATGARGSRAYPTRPGAGTWRGPQPPVHGAAPYGTAPWGPPGYAPGRWPNAPYFAPQGYGARQRPQQPQR